MTSWNPVSAYAWLRLSYVLAGLAGCWLLLRRPRPGSAVLLLLGLNLAVSAAYLLPIPSSYGLSGMDRKMNLGSAACVAAGHSIWDHVQVGYPSLEPFWDVLVASLSGFNPERVMSAYNWLTPLAIVSLTVGLWYGGRMGEASPERDWEAVLTLCAVLGLSSFSMIYQNSTLPFWPANFLHKPNHGAGWGVFALVIGLARARASKWLLGPMLALLGWIFIIHFGYAISALVVGTLLLPRVERRWRWLLASVALGVLLVLPDMLNLAREFNPFDDSGSSAQVWRPGELSVFLRRPDWMSLDLGPLFVGGFMGAAILSRRGDRYSRMVLGILVCAAALMLLESLAALFGFAPEPDELLYFLRFALALCAGSALAALARKIEDLRGLKRGHGHLLVLMALLPLSFPAYWNPPRMDRYFWPSLESINEKWRALGSWIRDETPRTAVFVAADQSGDLIPALTGRRVLLLGDARPPRDYRRRMEVERLLYSAEDPGVVLRAAAEYGVTHVMVNPTARSLFGPKIPMARSAFKSVFRFRRTDVYALRFDRAED